MPKYLFAFFLLCLFLTSCNKWQDKDLYIPEVFINAKNEIYLIVKNNGHTTIDETDIILRIFMDGVQKAEWNLDSLDPHFRKPGDSSIYFIASDVQISDHLLTAQIDATDVVVESNEDHNTYTIRLIVTDTLIKDDSMTGLQYPTTDKSFERAAYEALLKKEVVSKSIIWNEHGRPTPLLVWPFMWKESLLTKIKSLYSGQLKVPTEQVEFTREEAFDLYLGYIAHSLFVEQEQMVPWSVLNEASDHFFHLWNSDAFIRYDSISTGYQLDYQNSGGIYLQHPIVSYVFATGIQNLTTPEKAIESMLYWCRAYLHHSDRVHPGLYQRAHTIYFRKKGSLHEVHSCWATSGLILDYCRALNIPVQRKNIELYNGIHSSLYFPSIHRYLQHADDVYDPLFYPIGEKIPVEVFTLDENEYLRLENNQSLCIKDSCHTKGYQRTYDRRRWMTDRAMTHRSGTMLLLAKDNETGFKSYVQGDEFPAFLSPAFSTNEQSVLLQQINKQNPRYPQLRVLHQRYLYCKNNRN